MKGFARITCALVFAVVMALAFCGCTVNVTIGGSAASTSSAATGQTAISDSAASAKANSAGSASKGYSTAATASSGSSSQSNPDASSSFTSSASNATISVAEDGEYSDKEHVALYIHEFGHLPSNYISKTKARKAGWVSTKGNLWDVLPGKSIGGSEFYNDEGDLPDAKGRKWTECDIDYAGGYRNEKRIVFSNDGLVFYTGDHYKTFEQLY